MEVSNILAPEHLEICVDNPFDYLDKISDVFVEWRYSYEIVGKKRAVMQINTGFLNDFRNALREACCQLFFKLTWEEYKEL